MCLSFEIITCSVVNVHQIKMNFGFMDSSDIGCGVFYSGISLILAVFQNKIVVLFC